MKKRYKNILEAFSIPETRHKSEEYLKKYWLDEEEWQDYWQLIKNDIFNQKFTRIPEIMFKDNFNLIILIGGLIFTQKNFQALLECIKRTGDKFFTIIENEYAQPMFTKEQKIFHPQLKFKFPTDITWEQLMDGGHISFELFEMSYKEFFIFGDSKKWGKYAANDYWDIKIDSAGTPLDIIGFKSEYSSIFRQKFNQSKEEWGEIKEWIPANYKKLINKV